MHEAVHGGAGNVPADDFIPVHQQRGVHLVVPGVILHLVHVLGADLPGVGLQVEALGLLHDVVGGVHIVELGGNHDLPGLCGLCLHLPAKALQKGHALLVGAAGDRLPGLLLPPARKEKAGPRHDGGQQDKGENPFAIGF